MLTHYEILAALAREKLEQPDEWKIYAVNVENFDGPGTYYMVSGAVAPVLKRGKNKGHPNWRKLEKSTDLTIPIMPKEVSEFEDKWLADD